jgi:hypothetical protein
VNASNFKWNFRIARHARDPPPCSTPLCRSSRKSVGGILRYTGGSRLGAHIAETLHGQQKTNCERDGETSADISFIHVCFLLLSATKRENILDSPGRKAGDRTAKKHATPIDPRPSGLGYQGIAVSRSLNTDEHDAQDEKTRVNCLGWVASS